MSDDPGMTPSELAEEARAEEEFISTPEDVVGNPLVPTGTDGMISSGDYTHEDFTGGSDTPINNEVNKIKEENMGSEEEPKSIFAKPTKEETPAPEAPVEAPAETPAEAPVEQPQPAEVSPVAAAAPAGGKKKSKAGLVITLCTIGALLIGGGVVALIWFLNIDNPDNLVKDAVAKVYDAETINAKGNFDFKNENYSGNVDLSVVMAGKDVSINGTVKMDIKGTEAKLDIAAIEKDKKAYIKLDGLKKFPMEEVVESSEGDDAQKNMVKEIFSELSGDIDGKWYEIDSSVLNSIMSSSSSDCSQFDIKSLLNSDSKVKDAYKENSFLSRDTGAEVKDSDGLKYVKVKVDEEKSRAFLKAISGDAVKCVENSDSKDEKKVNDIYFGVKPFSHELKRVKIKDGDKTYDIDLNYEKKSIEKPSDVKTVTSLINSLESAVKTGLKNYAKSYAQELCESAYGQYGSSYVSACVEMYLPTIEKELENLKFEDILGKYISGFSGASSES